MLFACVWLTTLGTSKLLNPDEGRYAEIPREMLATGDWLTPRLNDLKYFEKPPLQYWATAVAFKIWGPTEFAARLWCGLTGLAGILFVGWVGGRLFGRNAGVIAGALLASSFMYFVLGHLNTLDMGLAFFLTVAIGAFLTAQREPVGSKIERNLMLLAWAAAALALLSKGIVALALPGMTLLIYSAIQRDYAIWRRLHIVPGLLLFLAIGAPWLIAVSAANPEFIKFFFWHEHVARFLTDTHSRVQPWWYFIPLVIAGALPWISLAVVATVKAWRNDADGALPHLRPRRFLVVWIAVVIVFFSASQSKLAPYILPIFPALALLVGDYVTRASSAAIRRHLLGIAAFWAIVLAYLVFGPLPHRRGIPPEVMFDVLHWVGAGAFVAMACAGAAAVMAGRDRIRAAILTMSTGTLLLLTILIVHFDAAREIRSGFEMAERIQPHLAADKPIYCVWTYDHSLAFYLQRNLTVVGYVGELAFGLQQEPGKLSLSLADFKQAWLHDPPGTIAAMKPEAFDILLRDGLPMAMIGRNLQLVAVKKP